ncbi:MAG: GGDEF domain-containing phosphodiesterase, partial [Deltaproteobacteria bacterium]
VGVSTGIAIFPENGEESQKLLQSADSAMYTAKRHKMIYAVFNPEEDKASIDRLILISQLRNAINYDQLVLHYQPKISLPNGRFCGVEVLLRWQHPEHGLILPNIFIPLAEQAGLIRQVSSWVLGRAIQQHIIWRDRGMRIPVAVNLSIKNLQDPQFPDQIIELLEKWRMDPKQLTLEITESSMMTEPKQVEKVISQLAELGIKMSIDDFGTGYSSLAYLCRFPAMEIKIDKSFITDMLRNDDNAVIVRSTIDMVHNIGRVVVAEGVEDAATMKHLEKLGCDFLQGFHIARPLSEDQLDDWLRQSESAGFLVATPAWSFPR